MENKNIELIDAIGKTVGDTSKEVKELKAEAANAKKEADEFKLEVKKLNETIAAKEGTLKDIQDAVNDLRSKQGKIITHNNDRKFSKNDIMAITMMDAIEKNIGGALLQKNMKVPLDLKAQGTTMTSSSALTGGNYIDFLPDAPGQRPLGQTRFSELVSTVQSAFDNVEFVVQSSPAATGSFDYQANEGDTKQELSYTWAMQSVVCKYFAGYVNISRQSLDNIPYLNSYLPINLNEDLLDREDLIFGSQLAAAATGSTNVSGTTVNIEQIIMLFKNLMKAKYKPNAAVIDPDKWASMLITKGTTSTYTLPNVVSIDATGGTRILGQPIYPVNWLSGGKIIVGEWGRAHIIQSKGLNMYYTDSHASNFIQNLVTYLLEKKTALAVERPDAFISTTLS